MRFARALLAIALVFPALVFAWWLFLLVLLSWPGVSLRGNDWGHTVRSATISVGIIVVSLTLAWRVWPIRKLSHPHRDSN